MKKVTAMLRVLGVGLLFLILMFPSTNTPIIADFTSRSSINIPSLADPLALYVGRDGIYNFWVTAYPSSGADQGAMNIYYVNGSTGETRIMLESVDVNQFTATYFVNDNPISILHKPHIFMIKPDSSFTEDYKQIYLYRLDPNENVSESISSTIPFNAPGSSIGLTDEFNVYTDAAFSPIALCMEQNVSLAWARHVNVENTTSQLITDDYTLVEATIYDPVNLTFQLTNSRPQELFSINDTVYGAMQLGDTGKTGDNPDLADSRFHIREHPLFGRIIENDVPRLVFFWYNSSEPMNKMTMWDLNTTTGLYEKIADVDIPFTYTDAGWIHVDGEDYFVFSKARFSFAQVDYFPEIAVYWLNHTSNTLVEKATIYKVLNTAYDPVSHPWLEMRNTEVYTDGGNIYVGVDNYTIVDNTKSLVETAGFLVGPLNHPEYPWHLMNDLDMEGYKVTETPSIGQGQDIIFYYTEKAQYNETNMTYGDGTLYWDSLIQSPWVTSPLTVITNVVSTETTTLETYTETINHTVTSNVTETVYEQMTVTKTPTQSSPLPVIPVLIALPLIAVIIKKRRK